MLVEAYTKYTGATKTSLSWSGGQGRPSDLGAESLKLWIPQFLIKIKYFVDLQIRYLS